MSRNSQLLDTPFLKQENWSIMHVLFCCFLWLPKFNPIHMLLGLSDIRTCTHAFYFVVPRCFSSGEF